MLYLVCYLQVVGMLAVTTTGVGCLYFFDSTRGAIASSAGLEAVGVFLVVFNAAWVLAVIRLIAKIGFPDVRTFVVRWFSRLRLLC